MWGINAPNKQKEAKLLCNEHNISLVGVLETKVKASRIGNIANVMFGGWEYILTLSNTLMGGYGLCGGQTFINLELCQNQHKQ